MKIKHRQRGSQLVEFSIFAVLFLSLLFVIIELAIMGWVNLTMQHAVREGVRYAITYQTDLDPGDPDDPDYILQRQVAVVERIRDSSMGLFDQLSPELEVNGTTITFPPNPGDFGNPGDILELRFRCNWELLTPFLRTFFPDGIYSFSVGATMRNELQPTTS
ncbi:hypothetical protein R50073_35920 [Maricurvus nonylphenolicus]|uniref:TadE/TadG family type IV pilus assembly protein n=1 Tax=Maricurvus nonylphenolicus TaxID=1008307 RepID=UPI0036F2633C